MHRLALLAVLALLTPAATATQWHVTDLGAGPGSIALDVNASRQIVGTFLRGNTFHAFLWSRGTLTDLGAGEAVSINDRGQVVINGVDRARLWESGRSTDLGTLGSRTAAAAVNDHGQVVGWSSTKARRRHAFIWQNGRMTDLGRHGWAVSAAVAINDAGQVVGWRKPGERAGAAQTHALLWQHARETDLGHGEPAAIDHRGHVVINTADGIVVWANGRSTGLDVPPRLETTADAINAQGIVLGTIHAADLLAIGPEDVVTAVVWSDGARTVLPGLHGSVQSFGRALNDRGDAVGSSGDRAVLWTRG